MDDSTRISEFLGGDSFAVVGASLDRAKYGNKCLRCYLQNGRDVVPIHPRVSAVEGLEAYPSLSAVPHEIHGASIVTPPDVTEGVVEDAARAGVRHLWMQPGAESARAVERAQELGLTVVAGGPCLLVALGFRE